MPQFDVTISRIVRLVGTATISAKNQEDADAKAQELGDEVMLRGFSIKVDDGKPAVEWMVESEELDDAIAEEV